MNESEKAFVNGEESREISTVRDLIDALSLLDGDIEVEGGYLHVRHTGFCKYVYLSGDEDY